MHGGETDALIRWAGAYDLGMRLWGRRGRRWRADLASRLDLQRGDRVLDVASGTGRLAFELAGHVTPGGSVEGVDASPEMVAFATRASRKLGLPVRFQNGYAQRLPFDDETFAAVTCTLALHHIAPDERLTAVEEIRRVLRPGGRLLIADFQLPDGRLAQLLVRLRFGHSLAERPVEQAVELMESARLSNITRTDSATRWLGLVLGTKPAAT